MAKIDRKSFPKGAVLSKVRVLSKRIEFPIKDFNDLANKIGTTTVLIGNHRLTISGLKEDIPKRFYPIKDQKDAETKANKLYDALVKD